MSDLVQQLLGYDAGKVRLEGFGQSALDDLRFFFRFRQCRRLAVTWRKPSHDEAQTLLADPFLGRFADEVCGLAAVAGRSWIVLERDWHGWPDPPQYAFFAIASGKIWVAADFHNWPRSWTLPHVDLPSVAGHSAAVIENCR